MTDDRTRHSKPESGAPAFHPVSDRGYFRGPVPQEPPKAVSAVQSITQSPGFWQILAYANLTLTYFVTVIFVLGLSLKFWHFLLYGASIYAMYTIRREWKFNQHREVAHKIPYVADAIANALSVGATLYDALCQAAEYTSGALSDELSLVVKRYRLGAQPESLFEQLRIRFKGTGIGYLTRLLGRYNQLGTGISRLLSQLSTAMIDKEESEERIREAMKTRRSYGVMVVALFGIVIGAFFWLFEGYREELLGPKLRPMFLILVYWAILGGLYLMRITSSDYIITYSLRPYVRKVMAEREWERSELLAYAGLGTWTQRAEQLYLYGPVIGAVVGALLALFYSTSLAVLAIGAFAGFFGVYFSLTGYIRGLAEDQLIATVRLFPDFLQVMTIGLDSGLNQHYSVAFAEASVEGTAPPLLVRELARVRHMMEMGETGEAAWKQLAERLPFEAVTDFSELMTIAPRYGTSVSSGLSHMIKDIRVKELIRLEAMGRRAEQTVTPVVGMAFLPLFMFCALVPLFTQVARGLS